MFKQYSIIFLLDYDYLDLIDHLVELSFFIPDSMKYLQINKTILTNKTNK